MEKLKKNQFIFGEDMQSYKIEEKVGKYLIIKEYVHNNTYLVESESMRLKKGNVIIKLFTRKSIAEIENKNYTFEQRKREIAYNRKIEVMNFLTEIKLFMTQSELEAITAIYATMRKYFNKEG